MRPARTSAGGDGGNERERPMEIDRSGQDIEVEIGLDAVTRTQARTKFVSRRPHAEPPKPPELGDPWCPLTVRARLQRVGWVLSKDPRVGPGEPKCGWPDYIRELFKDEKGDPMRIPVPAADQDAVFQVLKDLLRYRYDDEGRAVAFSIMMKMGGDVLGTLLGCSDTHARKLQKRMLEELASAWNHLPWRPDARDIERAKKLIHRNVK